jgi:hypothetical protein
VYVQAEFATAASMHGSMTEHLRRHLHRQYVSAPPPPSVKNIISSVGGGVVGSGGDPNHVGAVDALTGVEATPGADAYFDHTLGRCAAFVESCSLKYHNYMFKRHSLSFSLTFSLSLSLVLFDLISRRGACAA